MFSTNTPLHLVSFTCIDKNGEDDEDDEDTDSESSSANGESGNGNKDWNLSIKVEMTKKSESDFYPGDFYDTDAEVLMSTNVEIRSKPTKAILPWPILIQPGFYYHITIQDTFTCMAERLKDEVKVKVSDSDAIIKFHDFSKAMNEFSQAKAIYGLITSLEFVNIQNN